MNIFTYRSVVTGQIFTLLVAISIILSTLPVSFLVAEAAPVVLFSDDFESGMSNWYVPTSPWATASTVIAHSGASYTEASATSSTEIMILSLDTTGYENLSLSFWYQMDFTSTNSVAGFTVLESTDGTTYTAAPLGALGAADKSPSTWVQKVVPLSASLNNIASASLWLQFNNSTLPGYARIDDVEITGTPITPPACTPQFNVAGPTDVQNTDTSEYFNSIQDAIDDCDTVDGNTISVTGPRTTTHQITFTKQLTLEGNGNTISPTFTKTTNSNNAVVGIQADGVILQNLTINGGGGTNLHGVNAYQSTGARLLGLTILDSDFSAVVVNGSEMVIKNLTTSGSGWHAINVAQGIGVVSPSVLTIRNTSTHGETSPLPTPHIFIDDIAQDVVVVDTDGQYRIDEFPNPFIPGATARAYTLVNPSSLTITAPATDNETLVSGVYTFEAEYVDADMIQDAMRWAIRPSCTSSVNLAGNVGGLSDPSTYDGAHFEADVDMSTWADGDYCFIVNPAESGGNTDLREVRPFTLEQHYVISGYKWNDSNADGQWDTAYETGIQGWQIALRPMNMSAQEELFVSAESSAVTTSTTTLISGRTYIVEVEGTYSFGNRPDFVADAEWTHRTDGFQDSPLLPHGWTLGENTYPSVVGLDLQIDNQNIDWGAFNNDHLYKTIIEGDGTPLDFSIYDSYYGDNSGGLDVAIYDVTDYATTTDGNGLYTFEVPAGEYQIVEGARSGWSQTYPAGPSYYHLNIIDDSTGNNFGNTQADFDPILIITDPVADYDVLSGVHTFLAEYTDDDLTVDHINWAIRAGTCNANTNTVAGNVDGFNDPWTFSGINFQTTVDMSTWAAGDYCFVVNPAEQSGETDLRAVRWFTIEPTSPLTCEAGVNLLENPSFEEPVVTAISKWDILPSVGWIVKAIPGNAITGMELQRGVFGWVSSDGLQHTELDTTQKVRIKQKIDTIPGKEYTLTWDYAARPGTSQPESKMFVRINGHTIATNNEAAGLGAITWLPQSYTFIASSTHANIAFVSGGTSNGRGALLDNTSFTCNPTPTASTTPYCGDGDINQNWEQCEIGDEGCTDYCIFENQCTDLRLVKINLNPSQSISFDDTVYLGTSSNPLPNGTWFNFDEIGDASMNSIGNAVEGLAVSRDTSSDTLTLGFVGGNASNDIDFAIGTIETQGIVLGSIDRNPIPQWKLEDGSGGSFPDVFTKNGTTINFDLRADTGRDGVSVEIGALDEPYNCPLTQRVTGYKWNDEDGDGVRDEGESLLSGWTIQATYGSTTITAVTDSNGVYNLDVPIGQWIISEVQQAGWQQTGRVFNGAPATLGETTCSVEVNQSMLTSHYSMIRTPQCNFGNQQIETPTETTIQTEHNYGGRLLSRSGPTGQVLGVSTSNQCPFLHDFMQIGVKNDPWEVMKLQAFLNEFVVPMPITGFFGPITDKNVKKFQLQYKDEVLDPWFERGIVGHTNPTGFVYKTTLWKINDIVCPDYASLPDFEGEDLTHDVDID